MKSIQSINSMRSFQSMNFRRRGSEVTVREVLFVVMIGLVVASLGAFGITAIISNMEDNNSVYYKAMPIDNDKALFENALKTDAGNSLVFTMVKAVDTVGMPEINGKYMYLERRTEKYVEKTRSVTKTREDGSTYTEEETYEEWDTVTHDSVRNNEVSIFDHKYSINLFSLGSVKHSLSLDKSMLTGVRGFNYVRGNYVYESSFDSLGSYRYSYTYVPTDLAVNFLANLGNDTILPVYSVEKSGIVLSPSTISERLEWLEKSVGVTQVVFWVALFVLFLGFSVWFVLQYHPWLERN